MVVHHNTKFGYKRLQTNTQPSGNKYVLRTLHPLPLKTPQYFPFCSKTIHHTQCKKRSAEVNLHVRVGRKLMVLAEIILLCARMFHHFKTPRQPLLKQLLFQLLCLDRVTKTISVALLLTNNLDNSKQKKSNFRSPAPPPDAWPLFALCVVSYFTKIRKALWCLRG